jgi:hypothetical protein
MRGFLSISVKVIALVLLAGALSLSALAASETLDRLVYNGCLAQVFGGPKARSVSCVDGLLRLGVYFFMAGMAWWALHGALLITPVASRWRRFAPFAKYAGGTAGALVALLWVVPAAIVFFLFLVYPVILFVGTGVVLTLAWIFGHIARALGVWA